MRAAAVGVRCAIALTLRFPLRVSRGPWVPRVPVGRTNDPRPPRADAPCKLTNRNRDTNALCASGLLLWCARERQCISACDGRPSPAQRDAPGSPIVKLKHLRSHRRRCGRRAWAAGVSSCPSVTRFNCSLTFLRPSEGSVHTSGVTGKYFDAGRRALSTPSRQRGMGRSRWAHGRLRRRARRASATSRAELVYI